MESKSTDELEKILGSTHINEVSDYLKTNEESIITSEYAFHDFISEIIKSKNLKKQDVFLAADVSEKYGYKLLSGEKHTKQRDVILRLCYAAELSLEETQKALKLYRMPELYAKIPRDAMIMIAFNERPGSIIDVNSFLKNNGMEILRSSGVQE